MIWPHSALSSRMKRTQSAGELVASSMLCGTSLAFSSALPRIFTTSAWLFRQHVLQHLGRHEQAEPGVECVAQHRLPDGRDVAEVREALRRGARQQAQLVVLDVRQQRVRGVDPDLDTPREQVADRQRRALVGDVVPLRPGQELQPGGAEVRRAAVARGAAIQPARFRLGECHQLLH